jgi:hypothetical protein
VGAVIGAWRLLNNSIFLVSSSVDAMSRPCTHPRKKMHCNDLERFAQASGSLINFNQELISIRRKVLRAVSRASVWKVPVRPSLTALTFKLLSACRPKQTMN